MAVKKVELRLTSSGIEEAKAQLDELSKKLDSISRRRISPEIEIKGIDKSIADIGLLDVAMKKAGSTGSSDKGLKGIRTGADDAKVGLEGLVLGGLAAGKGLKTVEAGAGDAGNGITRLGGQLGQVSNYGMPILIGALVAAAPVLITAGLGMGAFGIAAVGAVEPIIKASEATGGLKANLKTLNPEQQVAAKSLLSLESSYKKFENALAPQVLQAFNDAMKVGKNLLGDFEPVAKVAGVAIDGMINTLGKDFQNGEWQQFFGFLQTNAGPDIAQLNQLFTDTLNAIPPLTEALHPLGVAFISDVDDISKFTAGLSEVAIKAESLGKKTSATASTGGINLGGAVKQAFSQIGGPAVQVGQKVVGWIEKMGSSSQESKGKVGGLASATAILSTRVDSAAGQITAETTALANQKKALETGLGALNNYVDATITQADDLSSLKTALKASNNEIGLGTAKQRAAYAQAQSLIEVTLKQAQAAETSGQGVGTQAAAISKMLPVLDHVKGKTAAYRQELAALKSILDKLRAEKNITDIVNIVVNGLGRTVSTGSGSNINGGMGGHLMADGGAVRGPGTGSSDSIHARLSNGEYVIRAAAVHAVGMGLLDRINSAGGGAPKRPDGYNFATGGKVSIPGFLTSGTPALDLIAGSGTIKTDIQKLITLVQHELEAGAIGQATETWLTSKLRTDNGKLETLANQRRKIVNTINAAESFRQGVKGNILSGFDITGVTNSAGGAPDAGDVMQSLKIDLSQVTQFANNIKKLGKMGLNKKLLRQIINAGPVSGGPVAAALAAASEGSIKNINHEENQIVDQSRRTSYIAAEELYDSGKQAGKGFLSGLKAQESNIEKEMRKIARVMVNTIKRELKIKSPSQVMHDLALQAGDGVALGLDHSSMKVQASAKRLAQGIPMSFGNVFGASSAAHMTPGGGGTTITIKGEGDDLVKAVVRALRYDIRTNGGGNVQKYLGWGENLMALNYVTLTLDIKDAQGSYVSEGLVAFTPSVQLTDSADGAWIPPAPVMVNLRDTPRPGTVRLLATDNSGPQPSGWGWKVAFSGVPGGPSAFSFFLLFDDGADQNLSALSPVETVTTMQAYMPLPSGTASARELPLATGDGSASAWGALEVADIPAGDPGQVLGVSASSVAIWLRSLDWLNVINEEDADPSGTNDSTAAFGNAVSTASSSGRPVYIPAGAYKISAALNWKLNGLVVKGDGAWNTVIHQTATNTPIVRIAGGNQEISGLSFTYASQEAAANIGSNAIEFGDDTIGSCFMCHYHDLLIQLANTGMAINPANVTSSGMFSCLVENVRINGYSVSAVNLNCSNGEGANGTGCEFSNIYTQNNYPGTEQVATGWPVNLQNWDEIVFNQLNIEHSNPSSSALLLLVSVGNAVINGLHFEDLAQSADNAALLRLSSGSRAEIRGMTCRFNTFAGATSNPVAAFVGAGNQLIIDGLNDNSNTVTTPSRPFLNYGTATGTKAFVRGQGSTQVTSLATTANAGCYADFGLENSGTAAFSGTGTQTVFNIAHGLGYTPSRWSVSPGSTAADGAWAITANATNLVVTYASAPDSGTSNVSVNWSTAV